MKIKCTCISGAGLKHALKLSIASIICKYLAKATSADERIFRFHGTSFLIKYLFFRKWKEKLGDRK
jgi:hypothetical protein